MLKLETIIAAIAACALTAPAPAIGQSMPILGSRIYQEMTHGEKSTVLTWATTCFDWYRATGDRRYAYKMADDAAVERYVLLHYDRPDYTRGNALRFLTRPDWIEMVFEYCTSR